MAGSKSRKLFEEAKKHIPGGGTALFWAVPFGGRRAAFYQEGKRVKVYVDGKAYIDYVLSWGPMIVGHAHARVTAAIRKAAFHGQVLCTY